MGFLKKPLIINLILVIITFAAVFLTGEILLRVLGLHTPKGDSVQFYEYDPHLGWRLKPNTTGKREPTGEYEIRETINTKGLRGPEVDYYKAEGDVIRILLLGDSWVEGYSVEYEQHFATILRKSLHEVGIRSEVIPAGVGGYSTDQEVLLFQKEGQKYHPDLTVLMFYDNDVWYNQSPSYWRGFKPLFKLTDDRLVLTNVPVPQPIAVSPNWGIIRSFPEDGIRWLIRNSALYYFMGYHVKNNLRIINWAQFLGEKPEIPDELGVYVKPCPTKIKEAWRVTEALIVLLKGDAHAIKGRLLVCYVPNRSLIYKHVREDTQKKYGWSDQDWDPRKVDLELEAICRRLDIAYVNPTSSMRNEAEKLSRQGQSLHYPRDGHWNIAGNRFIGEYLAGVISSRYANLALPGGSQNQR
jgi:hypothetical protein